MTVAQVPSFYASEDPQSIILVPEVTVADGAFCVTLKFSSHSFLGCMCAGGVVGAPTLARFELTVSEDSLSTSFLFVFKFLSSFLQIFLAHL